MPLMKQWKTEGTALLSSWKITGIRLDNVEDPELQEEIEDLRKQWQLQRVLEEEEGEYRSEYGLDEDFEAMQYADLHQEEDS